MFADPILDALLSNPEENTHLWWTNIKDNVDEKEHPDVIIALKSHRDEAEIMVMARLR
jgi:type I restriction-modification system DNA methylase subunit